MRITTPALSVMGKTLPEATSRALHQMSNVILSSNNVTLIFLQPDNQLLVHSDYEKKDTPEKQTEYFAKVMFDKIAPEKQVTIMTQLEEAFIDGVFVAVIFSDGGSITTEKLIIDDAAKKAKSEEETAVAEAA